MATTDYTPGPVPTTLPPQLRRYLQEELARIANQFRQELFAAPLAAPPPQPVDGIIAYADGVNWNPGAGAGHYGYQAGAWVKL